MAGLEPFLLFRQLEALDCLIGDHSSHSVLSSILDYLQVDHMFCGYESFPFFS